MRIAHSWQEHQARVKQLRRLGYRVKVVTLPTGDRLVLTSKKHFVCRADHCSWVRSPGGAPAVPWPRRAKKARRKVARRAR